MPNIEINWKTIAALGGVGLVLYLYAKHEAAAAASAVGQALNPVSDTNLASKAVNAVVKSVSGQDITLGTVLADIFQPSYNPNAPAASLPTGQTLQGLAAVAADSAAKQWLIHRGLM
jgi:hypothetical protein